MSRTETPWRLIVSPPARGSWNMALDEALFRLQEQSGRPQVPVLRFYSWEKPTLSIGYAQGVYRAADVAFCEQRDIPIVRRPTGGRTVLHAAEYTYSLTARLAVHPFSNSLLANYRRISEAFIHALRDWGVATHMESTAARSRPSSHLPCFAAPQVTEIISANGKKLIGSAQLKGRRAFLQQGSIPLNVDKPLLFAATGAGHPEAWGGNFAALGDFLTDIPPIGAFAGAVAAAFAGLYTIGFVSSSPSPDETETAAGLETEKYSSSAWNYRRPGAVVSLDNEERKMI